MNLFFVDDNPKIAAQSLCNKHVVKMILETAQMLSTAHYLSDKNRFIPPTIFRPAMIHNPINRWVRQNQANYKWALEHLIALFAEYTFRYEKVHSCEHMISPLSFFPANLQPAESISPPFLAIPNFCKISHNPVECYRYAYREVKAKTIDCRYKRREPPYWLFDVVTLSS